MDNKAVVLVVDDEPINRKILNKILSTGFEVLEAEDGQQAWGILCDDRKKKCDERKITAVLLDIVMPVMNGYRVLEKITEAGMTELPVIVITGESGLESEQKALDAGAWDFVTKPFKPKILLTRIKNAIARSQVSMYEQIKYMAEHDALTGLHNRSRMYADTKRMIEEHPEHEFAFIRVDIDLFSLYNSSFGEKEGDSLLCYVAELIRKCDDLFDVCTYGRMNADVFCVCIPCDGNIDMIKKYAELSQTKISEYRSDYYLKISVGVYLIDSPDLEVEELYLRSSVGAQKCKNQYGHVCGFYDESFGKRTAQELEILNEMKSALDEEQFVIYLQPKVALSTDHVCGAEALVRWNHPLKGLIPPGDFIPVFEKNGFIAKLDYYVWDKTCRLLRSWLDAGVMPYPVSVNISRISLYNPKLVSIFEDLIEKYQISPSLLQLEVTESAYMTNMNLMKQTVRELRNAGFTLLMDDFGSEYSSLNTLKSIEVDILKVDMKFLPQGSDMERGELILASVVRMANWLGMSVVVEGVETRRQRDFLEGVGCDCIQGYFYSRPIPQQEYEEKYVFCDDSQLRREEDNTEPSPEHNVSILVIDDDEMEREIICEYFKDQYHVHQVDNAEEGLVFLKKNKTRVRLILVDNIMDGMSGMDFLKFCQSEPSVQAIPIIMITANENISDHVEAFQAGACDYITKPLVKEVVKARVNRVMELSSQLRFCETAERDYSHQAEEDHATGLLNKAAFRKISSQVLGANPENQKAMMVIDVDDFKQVNDNYGHLVGDMVIKTLADALRNSFRKNDIIARFGGDEFIILLSSFTDQKDVRRKADELAKAFNFSCADQHHLNISISIGAAFHRENDTVDTLFARADQALYDAISTGKAKIVIYGEAVPPVENDDKPVILICGEDPQIYPSIALAYGSSAAFVNVTDFETLKESFSSYRDRICVICIDIQKRIMADSDEFYQYILEQGGGDIIPIVAICKEGDMDSLREAMKLHVQDVLTLPPQMDMIQRRLSKRIMSTRTKK